MKYAKALAAFVGGLTPGALVGLAALAGVDMDPATAAAIVAALAPLTALIATVVGPANKQ